MIDSQTKIIVCIGSGGVGKTTLSASLGVWGALAGKKVLVLTVDPARRLATTFHLKADGSEQKIDFPEATKVKGELWASVLNSKQIFDDFVRRSADKGTDTSFILNNKLYRQLSTTLSGSQEFTALEKLYSAYESQKYDLIVLDTPPTKHAIDFLQAPEKIANLLSESIIKWFRPSKTSLFNFNLSKDSYTKSSHKESHWTQQFFQFGTQKALQILQTLTGAEFISELQDFFSSIEGWQSQLENRTQRVNRLLRSKETVFNLITAFDAAKLEEAKSYAHLITQRGYQLQFLTVNRSFPNWLPPPFHSGTPTDQFCLMLNKYYETRLNSLNHMTRAINGLDILMLPEYDHDIADLDGLIQLVRDYKWLKGKGSFGDSEETGRI